MRNEIIFIRFIFNNLRNLDHNREKTRNEKKLFAIQIDTI